MKTTVKNKNSFHYTDNWYGNLKIFQSLRAAIASAKSENGCITIFKNGGVIVKFINNN